MRHSANEGISGDKLSGKMLLTKNIFISFAENINKDIFLYWEIWRKIWISHCLPNVLTKLAVCCKGPDWLMVPSKREGVEHSIPTRKQFVANININTNNININTNINNINIKTNKITVVSNSSSDEESSIKWKPTAAANPTSFLEILTLKFATFAVNYRQPWNRLVIINAV